MSRSNTLRPGLAILLANGAMLIEEFEKSASLGGGPELRFRIML